jgi:hypothetical protein
MVNFGFSRYSVRRRRPYLSCSFRERLLVSCRWAYLCSASSLEVWIWSRCHQCNAWSSRFQIQVLTALFILCIHIPDSLSESAASAVSADLCHIHFGGQKFSLRILSFSQPKMQVSNIFSHSYFSSNIWIENRKLLLKLLKIPIFCGLDIGVGMSFHATLLVGNIRSNANF